MGILIWIGPSFCHLHLTFSQLFSICIVVCHLFTWFKNLLKMNAVVKGLYTYIYIYSFIHSLTKQLAGCAVLVWFAPSFLVFLYTFLSLFYLYIPLLPPWTTLRWLFMFYMVYLLTFWPIRLADGLQLHVLYGGL